MRNAILGVLLVLAPALAAQNAPKRPKLAKGADTNDARVYFEWGRLDRTPWKKAYDAFYWAFRLEPNVPDYLVALQTALVNQQSFEWRVAHDDGVEFVVKSKEAKAIDSVTNELLQRVPIPRYDAPCFNPGETDQFFKDPLTAGRVHFFRNCYPFAVAKLKDAIARDSSLVFSRIPYAEALYFTGQFRTAAGQIQIVLDSLRGRDAKYVGVWYNTKEYLEHMLAEMLLRARDLGGARAALGRALTENLSYFPAHAMLAKLAMDDGQISTALQEMELAVGLREDDGVLHFDYGTLLYRSGRLDEAAAQFGKAVELEPYWAEARRQLGLTLDKLERRDEAITAYEAFLARAPMRENIRIKEVTDRVAELRAGT